jgi:hypothetical protein
MLTRSRPPQPMKLDETGPGARHRSRPVRATKTGEHPGFSGARFSGGRQRQRVPGTRVTIRVTTPWDLKGSSGVIRDHLHSQVRLFSSAVTLLMALNRLPKLDVAGSNPVGRSKNSRGYGDTRNPLAAPSDRAVTTATLRVPRLRAVSRHSGRYGCPMQTRSC